MGKSLDDYESDTFNQPNNPSKAFHIWDYTKLECQYCESQSISNNKLHYHLQENYKR